MNSCILMAEIVQDPQLRYTSDNQIPIAEMLVQFDGLRDGDPPETLKVIGWGNLAQEIQEHYHQGDRIVIEGRINMNTLDRPEGFREKRAELTAQRIYRIGSIEGGARPSSAVSDPTAVSYEASPQPKTATPSAPSEAPPIDPADYDDIPF
ncbi:MAG: single-stranded DNA-binding protein [Elainellaceae cyanobacterium]